MLILPVRPQPPNLRDQESNDSCTTASSTTARPDQESQQAPEQASQSTGAMTSIMPPPKPPMPKRPKLSLQTFAAASLEEQKPKADHLLSPVTDTPIYTNAFSNAFTSLPSTPTTAQIRQEPPIQPCATDDSTPQSSDPSSTASSSSGLASPFYTSPPYTLPIGARSILSNSPLPRRHLSAISMRVNRRMFQPVKKVTFCEVLEDFIPQKVVEHSSGSETEGGEKRPRAAYERCEYRGRKTADEQEDLPATPIQQRRRKRRREWVWRPVDDDVLAEHLNEGMAFRRPCAESSTSADDGGSEGEDPVDQKFPRFPSHETGPAKEPINPRDQDIITMKGMSWQQLETFQPATR